MTDEELTQRALSGEVIGDGQRQLQLLAARLTIAEAAYRELAGAVVGVGRALFGGDDWKYAQAAWWQELRQQLERHSETAIDTNRGIGTMTGVTGRT